MNQMGEEEETTTWTTMDDKLYEAARMKAGDIPSTLITKCDWFLGRTPELKNNILHVAAQYGNAEFINSALSGLVHHHHYHLLCQLNSKGQTPLHVASRFGDIKTVQALLLAHDHNHQDHDRTKKKLCWSERDRKGDTPLHMALRYGHQDIAMLLLQKDDKLVSVDNNAGESPAYLAADNYCQGFLRTILDGGRYVDQGTVSYSGPLGMTLFHPSISLTEDIMLVLIKRRKQVFKQQDNKGKTVLHYAVEKAIEPMVSTLIKADSSLPCIHDNNGMTPLHRAANMGSFSMVRTILELSPQSIEICDLNHGKTALHLAKMDACFLVGCLRNTRMKELINVADNQGNTPLHLAFKNSSDLDVVYALLQTGGVNWRLRNNDGCTPVDLWQSHENIPLKLKSLMSEWRVREGVHKEVLCDAKMRNVDELMEHSSSWDERLTYTGPDGDNILHIAARHGNIQLINQLTTQDQSSAALRRRLLTLLVSGENSKGETPLHVAAENGQIQVVQAILSLTDDQYSDDGDEKKLAAELPWRMRSANGDTPTHKALKNGHVHVALCLLSKEPQLVGSVNSANESLLYLAAQLPSSEVIAHILSESNKGYPISASGPHGQNPLHALITSGGRVTNDVVDIKTMFMKIMPFDMTSRRLKRAAFAPWIGTPLTRRLPELVKQVDNDGKTPLHYAAELGQHSVVMILLKADISACFMFDNEGFTPLLRAAANGYDHCVKAILELCPSSIELRHASDKRTVLHLANLPKKTLKKSIKNHHQVFAKLLNETDIDGNTPLHCAILESDQNKALELLSTKGLNFGIKNKKDQTPMELCNLMRKGNIKQETIWLAFKGGSMAQARKSRTWLKALLPMVDDLLLLTEDDMKKLLDNVAVVAALLVTLTFAATFAIPGGYDIYTGQAARMDQHSIQVFLVADVVAMLLGISVLLNYTFGVINHASWGPLALACVTMLRLALRATVVAFVSGVYAIAEHDANWIGVLAIVLAAFNFIVLY